MLSLYHVPLILFENGIVCMEYIVYGGSKIGIATATTNFDAIICADILAASKDARLLDWTVKLKCFAIKVSETL
jgi:hypothetical protein